MLPDIIIKCYKVSIRIYSWSSTLSSWQYTWSFSAFLFTSWSRAWSHPTISFPNSTAVWLRSPALRSGCRAINYQCRWGMRSRRFTSWLLWICMRWLARRLACCCCLTIGRRPNRSSLRPQLSWKFERKNICSGISCFRCGWLPILHTSLTLWRRISWLMILLI
jgi:hypothetical protein